MMLNADFLSQCLACRGVQYLMGVMPLPRASPRQIQLVHFLAAYDLVGHNRVTLRKIANVD